LAEECICLSKKLSHYLRVMKGYLPLEAGKESMKKTAGLFFILLLTAASAPAQTPTPTVAASGTIGNSSGMMNSNSIGDYVGIGGGLDLPIQNAEGHHGVLALVSGRQIAPNLVGEGEFDGMAYGAGANGGLLDMRLFATVKLMPDTPFIQPYGLLGFGFAGLLGIDVNTPNLLSLDFVWGGGFRVELVRRVRLYLDYKMHILVRDYPTAIDSPLTGGITFPL
jgi:hypothetical protein